jgi:hypothetical protein
MLGLFLRELIVACLAEGIRQLYRNGLKRKSVRKEDHIGRVEKSRSA